MNEASSSNTPTSRRALPVIARAVALGRNPAGAILTKIGGAIGVGLACLASRGELTDTVIADVVECTEVSGLGSSAGRAGRDATFLILARAGGTLRALCAGSSGGAGTSPAEEAFTVVDDIWESARCGQLNSLGDSPRHSSPVVKSRSVGRTIVARVSVTKRPRRQRSKRGCTAELTSLWARGRRLGRRRTMITAKGCSQASKNGRQVRVQDLAVL